MPIDFSYLEGAAPQEENTPKESNTANVTIRVDADSLLLCDGDYIDQQFKAGTLTKIQLPLGQHLLEFLYEEDPEIKIEKEVDFPESGKSYLVIIKGLKDLVDGAAEEEAKQKAKEEAKQKADEEAKRKAAAEAKRKTEAAAKAKIKAEIKKTADLAEDYYYGRNGKSEDYEKAVEYYRIAAEAGDAYSQYSLGFCYENGQGVKKSAEDAARWYGKAAKQGESKAKERLEYYKKRADTFYYGRNGMPQMYEIAVINYHLAAEAGDAYSQYRLGYCYEKGLGVEADDIYAVEWYRKAAEQGEEHAKKCLKQPKFSYLL